MQHSSRKLCELRGMAGSRVRIRRG